MQSWLYGMGLIVVTIVLHAASLAIIGLALRDVWERLNAHARRFRHGFANWTIVSALLGLLLGLLHGVEAALWAALYWRVGALGSFSDALFYSIDSMTTRGASGLALPTAWREAGALEGADGMLLFGISTAFVFAVMQIYWRRFTQISETN